MLPGNPAPLPAVQASYRDLGNKRLSAAPCRASRAGSALGPANSPTMTPAAARSGRPIACGEPALYTCRALSFSAEVQDVMTRSFIDLGTGCRRLAGLGLVAVAGLLLAGCGVNNIPRYEEAAKSAWGEVLNQYKRRSDLIPNLVETVKGFAEQERRVLTEVVEARAKATQTTIAADKITDPEAMKKFQEAQSQLSGALSRLLVTVERYPDIKSNQNFLQLQSQLEGTENRIAIARRDFNSSVQRYNTEIKTIPGKWWKSFMYPESKEMAYFTTPEEDTRAPKVNFGTGSSPKVDFGTKPAAAPPAAPTAPLAGPK
jgi:LemA protein